MKLRKLLLFFSVFVIILAVLLFRGIFKADAVINFGADIESYYGEDGELYHAYNIYFTATSNETFNHIEGFYEEIGLVVTEFEALGDFVLENVDLSNKTFSLTSNTTYSSADGKVYFARVISQYANPDYTEECSLRFYNVTSSIVSVNDVDITKTAILEKGAIDNLTKIEQNTEFYYKITIKNTSSIPTDEVNFIDEIPSELEVLDVDFNGISGNRNGNTITYTLDSLDVSEEKTIYVYVKLIDATKDTLINTASITINDKEKSANYEIDILKPNLEITKDVSEHSVKRNDIFTYTINISNNVASAYDVVLKDTIDKNFTIIDTNYENSGNENELIFELGNLSPDTQISVVITLKANADAELKNYINTAVVSANNHEEIEDSADVTVTDDAVFIKKRVSKDTVRPGDEFSYYIDYGNTGSASSDRVVISDTIDSRLSIVSANGANISGNNLTWEIGSIPEGAENTLEIVVRVNDNVAMNTVINNVVVLKEEGELDKEDFEKIEVIDSDVSIEKLTSKHEVKPNEEFDYVIKVKNNGSAASKYLTITDIIDTNLEIVSANGANINGQTITYTIPSLNVSEEKEYIITVKVKNTVNDATVINNLVTLKEDGKPDKEDEEQVVVRKPILRVEKYVDKNPAIYNVGEEFIYNIAIYNDGSIASDNVTVTDNISDLLTIIDSDSGIVNKNNITWNIDSIAPNSRVLLQVKVKAKNVLENTTIKNIVVVKHNDEQLTDEEDILVITSDLYLFKSVSKKQIRPNEEFSYTITFGNNGDAVAKNILITDMIPDGIKFVEAFSDNANIVIKKEEESYTFNIDTLNPGEEFNITIKAIVNSDTKMDEVIKNTAILTFENEKITSEVDIVVIDTDLSITKISNKQSVVNKEKFNYTISITNNGSVPADNIVVKDVLDESLELINCDNCNNITDNIITWNIPTIGVNETKNFVVTVKIDNQQKGYIIKNKAILIEDGKPNKEDEEEVLVVDYNISIRKSVSKNLVKIEEPFTYYIYIKNESDIAINNIKIVDTFDTNLDIIDANGGIIKDDSYVWNISLLPNEEYVIEISAAVKKDTNKNEIINIANMIFDDEKIPSNEVKIEIVNEEVPENPSTGSSINYILMILALIVVMFILRKKNIIFKI